MPDWCQTEEHWTSRLVNYLFTSCPCCMFYRGFFFGGSIVLFEQGWPAGGYERFASFSGLAERLVGYDLVQAGPGYRIHAQRHR